MKVKVYKHQNYTCYVCNCPFIPSFVGTQLIYRHLSYDIPHSSCPQKSTWFIVKLNVEEIEAE